MNPVAAARDAFSLAAAASAPGTGDRGLVLFLPEIPPLGLDRERGLDLATPWPRLPRRESCPRIFLDHLVNHLSMIELRQLVHRATWLLEPGGELRLLARNPDLVMARSPSPLWAGEETLLFETPEIHRPLRQYCELFRLFPCRLLIPCPIGEPDPEPPFLRLRAIHSPATGADFHDRCRPAEEPGASRPEPDAKYHPGSRYRRFNRLEEPEIVDDLLYAISRMRARPDERLLSLGVNDGRELELFRDLEAEGLELCGIDASCAAIEQARARFPAPRHRFVACDLDELGDLDLPRFELVLLLNVLQCRGVDRRQLLDDLKGLLAPHARVLVSIPNCTLGAEDLLRRPLERGDPRHDRSLVFKDLRHLARHFYRAGFRETETFGTYDGFLLARR